MVESTQMVSSMDFYHHVTNGYDGQETCSPGLTKEGSGPAPGPHKQQGAI